MSCTLPPVGKWPAVSSGILVFFSFTGVGALGAQALALKRDVPGDGGFDCPAVEAGGTPTEEERTEARRLGASADQALILGELERAQALLQRATELDPASPDLAYRYARVLEDAGEGSEAVFQYCRTLALGRGEEEIGDAPERLRGILSTQAPGIPREGKEAFRIGLRQADSGNLEAALEAFNTATDLAPEWADALFNRGVVNARMGRVDRAIADLETYASLRPDGGEGESLVESLERLRSLSSLPMPSTALTRGLLVPGGGQFYAGRRWQGFTVLSLAAGALAFGLLTEEATVTCVGEPDPGGECPPDRIVGEETGRPYLVYGLVGAGAVMLGGALEAFFRTRSVRARELGALLEVMPEDPTVGGPQLSVRGSRMYLSLIQVSF
jgi:tetratricopeptide (TPR) repeat protein